MKKITDYRALLGVTRTTELKELKNVYRKVMKECHPDRFFDNQELKQQAEERSKNVIEAYHFLVSIAPETIAQSLPEYEKTTSTSAIADHAFERRILKITFTDGNSYEYFDVPKEIYAKFVNADSPARFARRHIYNAYLYRSLNRLVATEA